MHTATLYRGERKIFDLLFCLLINFHDCGVAKQIQECQPKAHITHCHGYFLSLSEKDVTNNSHCEQY